VHRLLEVESSGWRNELRLRVFDSRSNRPHVEVFQLPDYEDRRQLLADDQWHMVSIELSSTISTSGEFYVRVHVDCTAVAGRRVDGVQLSWTRQTEDLSALSYLWIGQRTDTQSALKASCFVFCRWLWNKLDVFRVMPALRPVAMLQFALILSPDAVSALARHSLWRRGCLCVCHVDVLCPNDESIIMRPSPDCSPDILVFPYQI